MPREVEIAPKLRYRYTQGNSKCDLRNGRKLFTDDLCSTDP